MINERTTDVLFCIWSEGIGDTIAATPIIRTFCENHGNRKVDVWTRYPEIFKYSPWVAKVHTQPNPDLTFFAQWPRPNIKVPFARGGGGPIRHYRSHLATYCAVNADGLELTPEEMQYEMPYGKDEARAIRPYLKGKRERRIVLHPNDTWFTRRMPQETWTRLKEGLLEDGYTVYLVGKDMGTRSTVTMNRKGAIDLIDRLSLLETAALLDKCAGIVTMDSGTLCIAGTVPDIHIFAVLTINPACFRAPYRNGDFRNGVTVINERVDCLYCATRLDRIDMNLANCVNFDAPMACLPGPGKIRSVINAVLK